jgi:hypothetical protein
MNLANTLLANLWITSRLEPPNAVYWGWTPSYKKQMLPMWDLADECSSPREVLSIGIEDFKILNWGEWVGLVCLMG